MRSKAPGCSEGDPTDFGSPEWRARTYSGPIADDARALLAMDPATRQMEIEARKAEADAQRIAAIHALSEEETKRAVIGERVADKELEKEKVKKGLAPGAKQRLADPNSIVTEFAMGDNQVDTRLDFLVEPFLPRASVVGFYGRGETAKSSFLATLAADISSWASTLWVSTEENEARIRQRHTKGIVTEDGEVVSQGAVATLQAYKAIVQSTDANGNALTSDFNTYEHLEPAIIKAKTKMQNLPPEHRSVGPLRLVVLDTLTALTTWDRQAGPNSDEGVKRVMAYLRGVAERHDVTIAVVGHSNKGKHEHFADSVMGATAWVNSPRISFLHAKDMQTEGQVIVRVAKANEIPHMAQLFRVCMVHELHQFADGPKAGLMKVLPGARVWGGRDAEELWDEVTARLPEGAEGGFVDGRRLTVVDKVFAKLVEMVHAGQDQFITRQQVEVQLGHQKVNRVQWKQVDERVRVSQFSHRVIVTTGAQNITRYTKADEE